MILGCCDTIGSQAGDVARTAWLVAGLPDHVPGVTIDRQCGSSQQAVHFAAQGVMSGTQDLVVAGGVQNMSAIPISAAMLVGQQYGFTTPFAESPGWLARYGDQEVSQFRSAEMIAEKWDITPRGDGGVRARLPRARAHRDRRGPLRPRDRAGRPRRWASFATDECPRETSLEKMAGLEPLAPGGRITAAVASQICDASSAMLIASEQAVADHGLTPRARIHHLSVRGDDPVWMLTGPIRGHPARAGRRPASRVDDIDLFECNEAFASVVLAWMKETGVPHEQGQRQRRRHRARPPDRRHRHPDHDDAAQRARAHRRPLRPADHVRGRRPGQRDDHRAAVIRWASSRPAGDVLDGSWTATRQTPFGRRHTSRSPRFGLEVAVAVAGPRARFGRRPATATPRSNSPAPGAV